MSTIFMPSKAATLFPCSRQMAKPYGGGGAAMRPNVQHWQQRQNCSAFSEGCQIQGHGQVKGATLLAHLLQ